MQAAKTAADPLSDDRPEISELARLIQFLDPTQAPLDN